MTDLLKKLNEVLEKDKEAEMASEPGEREQKAKTEKDPLRKVRRAEEQVAYLSDLFHIYVSDNVMLEHPELFAVARMGYREANRKPEVFGVLRPSAEHRVIAVTFKSEYMLYARFSALILSRELEVVGIFCKRGLEAARVTRELELAQFRDGPGVDWKKAFEALFVSFLGWYEKQKQ